MAAIVGEERYVFNVDWYDQQAELIRYYRIIFFPGDSTIEMVRISLHERLNMCSVRHQEQQDFPETVSLPRGLT